ncbi:hypothetical protein [Arthrobacter sp. ISL-72]|nr:hypothetical protein [Arthrobacter sp. ISL-72]MBT2597202.1 hypothetical protein [Arthrobacter sp. ISL-72]
MQDSFIRVFDVSLAGPYRAPLMLRGQLAAFTVPPRHPAIPPDADTFDG